MSNRNKKVEISQITFGVELEVTMPRGATPVGPHGSGVQVPWLPAGWLADGDPSIVARGPSRQGVEFVSPVLMGADGLRQVVEAIHQIKARGGQVNPSGGMHVHVGLPAELAGNQLKRLIQTVHVHQQALYAATGTKRRERGCWCADIGQVLGSVDRGNIDAVRQQVNRAGRYYLLNLQNWAYGRRPTAEFRVFSGTLNPTKALAYVQMAIASVARAINGKGMVPFTAKPAHEQKAYRAAGGPGAAAMAWWLDCFGWTSDERAKWVIEGDGLPTASKMAGELKRLAAKYDANDDAPTYQRRNGAAY